METRNNKIKCRIEVYCGDKLIRHYSYHTEASRDTQAEALRKASNFVEFRKVMAKYGVTFAD